MKIVSYLRVSTRQQGISGLGLEAQRAAIEAYAVQRSGKVIETFTEVESGKLNSRPELLKALHLAKVTGATLVIAKLDRLSRNAAFLLTLRDSGVRFIAADMPDANDLTVGIMALVAQQEREAISRRTTEALAAAKARGVRLGNPNGAAALKRADKGNAAGVAAIRVAADSHAKNLQPVINSLASEGMTSLGAVAEALNERGMLTPRGGRWHKSSVRNLLNRLGNPTAHE
ncbi:recombinase family protein [Rhodanobacter sp. A1T4]|uniref:recombinase family protein n=1 Tax=Rhodanobacter sp. A1T4 TaxID=2723087 RepID=UPI00160CF2D3|nr:recombinase family protein [Rhodanobacter sp. A1T4]MBB6248263.1 DNA invertase Pin-like site-specific DNA recombinase [Rhodanobacter sp. A1T4]